MASVSVFVLSPDTRSERKFDRHLTVGQLKIKLEPITGIPVESQKITLHASEDDPNPVALLAENGRPLGYYSIRDWQVLKVVDANPSSMTGQLHDVSQVEKFEMSDKDYESRRDTVLTYKKQNKMGRFAPNTGENTTSKVPSLEIPIGSRCETDFGENTMKKRGVVRFVGSTKFGGGGLWVGVEYDEPLGKNDGSVQGERYFSCKPSYGAFVRPDKVKIGDFPPIDPLMEEDEI